MDKPVTLGSVLSYCDEYARLGLGKKAQGPLGGIKHLQEFQSHADDNGYNPITSQERQASLMWAIDARFPGLAREAKMEERSFEVIFAPIIPNSPLLAKSRDDTANPIVRGLATIALVVEIVLREAISALISLGLYLYSWHKPDDAAYYQLRLDINRHQPLQVILNKVTSLVGGY